MRSNNSGCLTAFVSSFSRIMLLMVWIARPVMMNATFSTFILPCLGFMFLPFTTLMYVFLKQGVGTIQGLDWLWLFLAVILDIASDRRCRGGQPQSHPCRLSWFVRGEGIRGASAGPADCGDTACHRRPLRPHPTSRRNRSRNKQRSCAAKGGQTGRNFADQSRRPGLQ